MKRYLLNLLAAVSLVLCIAAAAMWVGSYLPDALWLRWVDGRLVLAGANDRNAKNLSEAYFDAPPSGSAGVRPLLTALRRGGGPFPRAMPRVAPRRFEALGVKAFDAIDPSTGKRQCWLITVPGVYPVALTAVAPAAWLAASLRRRRRAKKGHCSR